MPQNHDPHATTVYVPADKSLAPPPVATAAAAGSSAPAAPMSFRLADVRVDDALVALRQSRLRAVALFFAIVVSVLAIPYSLVTGGPSGLHALIAAGCITYYVVLRRSRCLSARTLRLLEYSFFAMMVVGLCRGQYLETLAAVAANDPLQFQFIVFNGRGGMTLLLFAYGMFMPNRWQDALVVAACMFLGPITMLFSLWKFHPEVLEFVERTRVMTHDNPLQFLAVAVLSVYGAHILNTMRQEAFEARRLNQYRLVRRLGSGSMGEVHVAEHRLMRRPCAVKLIHPKNAGDRATLERFEREVRATARISHPNVVEIYDFGVTEDRTFYYVMEFLRGLDLAALVQQFGPLPPERAVWLLRQACDGLAEAHAAGLIHRDLKPANMVAACIGTRFDVVKLVDFGLVKESTVVRLGDEPAGAVSGTPLYMSPEQIRAEATLDGRCDLYALGAVAYFLVTGRPPFAAASANEAFASHLNETPAPPSRWRPEVHADVDRIVLQCLEKDPNRRFQTALDLRRALDSCAVAARWDSDRAAEWWQRHPLEGSADRGQG